MERSVGRSSSVAGIQAQLSIIGRQPDVLWDICGVRHKGHHWPRAGPQAQVQCRPARCTRGRTVFCSTVDLPTTSATVVGNGSVDCF